jgi:hypothetical protein
MRFLFLILILLSKPAAISFKSGGISHFDNHPYTEGKEYHDIGFSWQTLSIEDAQYIEESILLAMLINSECRGCTVTEKMLIGTVVINRADTNFGGFGLRLYDQIFAKNQFSGSVNKGKLGRMMYYDPTDKYCEENREVASYLLNLPPEKRYPCNILFFCNTKIATNRREVERQKKYALHLGTIGISEQEAKLFQHDVFAVSDNKECFKEKYKW